MGKYLGKINLEEDCPEHPFVKGAILFAPKPPIVSKITSQSTKENMVNKALTDRENLLTDVST